MKYRMYIDEVGDSSLSSSLNTKHRYLSLSGVIIELEYVKSHVFPQLERLKSTYFDPHPDEPVILHRKDIMNRKGCYAVLLNKEIQLKFNREVLSLLQGLDYRVITVAIDKLEHLNKYNTWRFDPYHYCLMVLVERFALWLFHQHAVGDVMVESRGGKEDRRLKDSFERLYSSGTDYVESEKFEQFLTSKQLKVKKKDQNIAGLQLADLIAHPSFKASLLRHQRKSLPNNYGGKIAQTIEEAHKYIESPEGKIDGWGRKWLP